MALSKLENLYRQVILDHSQHPKNKGIVENADAHTLEMNNPTCGDVITLQLVIDDEQVIQKVHFDGHGCSISMASASMMTVALQGKTIQEALELSKQFSLLVQGESIDVAALQDANLLSGVSKFPARIKCATLAWKAFERLVETSKE